eukprot:Rmarinus@m.19182
MAFLGWARTTEGVCRFSGARLNLQQTCSASNQIRARAIPTDVSCLIVGGGLTGLSTAYEVSKIMKGQNLLVAEASERPGGVIGSVSKSGIQWETGPHTFQPTPELLSVFQELGVLDDLVLADAGKPRYVVWNDALHPIPMSLSSFLFRSAPLLTLSGKIDMVTRLIGLRRSVPSDGPSGFREQTVHEFIVQHLGTQAYERLFEPFVGGVYAGDADALSMEAAFPKLYSIFSSMGLSGLFNRRSIRRKESLPSAPLTSSSSHESPSKVPSVKKGELGSFRYGMQQLTDAYASSLGDEVVKCGYRVERIRCESNRMLTVTLVDRQHRKTDVRATSVVMCTPAYVTADVLSPLFREADVPDPTTRLRDIDYPPLALVVSSYPKASLGADLNGFGHLVPRCQRNRTVCRPTTCSDASSGEHVGWRHLGSIWVSSLFSGRIPDDRVLMSTFVGGATHRDVEKLSDDDVAQLVHSDLGSLIASRTPGEGSGSLVDNGIPVGAQVHCVKRYTRAIPQFTIGHLQRVSEVKDALLAVAPGVVLGGSFVGGVAIGDCVTHGKELARQALARIKNN